MACRGMFYALTADQEAALMATRDEAEVLTFLEELEMGDWDGEQLDCETDKAWDAMHRCLSDGTLIGGGRSPLDLAVLGGGHHYEGDVYIVAHVLVNEVVQVAAALEAVDATWMRQQYDRIDRASYQGIVSDEDFEYTWYWFMQVRDFYRKAAAAGRSVIFTADQ